MGEPCFETEIRGGWYKKAHFGIEGDINLLAVILFIGTSRVLRALNMENNEENHFDDLIIMPVVMHLGYLRVAFLNRV